MPTYIIGIWQRALIFDSETEWYRCMMELDIALHDLPEKKSEYYDDINFLKGVAFNHWVFARNKRRALQA